MKMNQHKFVIKRIVSPDGKFIAEAKSIVSISGDRKYEISQSISVNI